MPLFFLDFVPRGTIFSRGAFLENSTPRRPCKSSEMPIDPPFSWPAWPSLTLLASRSRCRDLGVFFSIGVEFAVALTEIGARRCPFACQDLLVGPVNEAAR